MSQRSSSSASRLARAFAHLNSLNLSPIRPSTPNRAHLSMNHGRNNSFASSFSHTPSFYFNETPTQLATPSRRFNHSISTELATPSRFNRSVATELATPSQSRFNRTIATPSRSHSDNLNNYSRSKRQLSQNNSNSSSKSGRKSKKRGKKGGSKNRS
jgi:hypothetical protein